MSQKDPTFCSVPRESVVGRCVGASDVPEAGVLGSALGWRAIQIPYKSSINNMSHYPDSRRSAAVAPALMKFRNLPAQVRKYKLPLNCSIAPLFQARAQSQELATRRAS